jgi:ubiquinone/menaquinone biosynthesis C-methylase UbiE
MTDEGSDAYGRIARYYDRVLEPLDAPLRPIAMDLYPVDASTTVLDVGCGTGSFLEFYADADATCYGIDLSRAMLGEATRKLGNRAHLQRGDATALPYDDGMFQLVTATLFLHELDPRTRIAALAEMVRVVNDDGRVLVIDYYSGRLTLKGHVMRAVSAVPERIAGRTHHREFRRYLELGGIPAMAPEAGLVVDRERVIAGGNLALWLLRAAD